MWVDMFTGDTVAPTVDIKPRLPKGLVDRLISHRCISLTLTFYFYLSLFLFVTLIFSLHRYELRVIIWNTDEVILEDENLITGCHAYLHSVIAEMCAKIRYKTHAF